MKINLISLLFLMALLAILPGCEQDKTNEIDNFKLAEFYLEHGSDKKALEILGVEFQKNKNLPEAHQIIGSILNTAEYYDDAIFHFKSSIELGCGQTCVEGLIDAYLGQGEIDSAEQEYLNNISDKKSETSKYRAILIEFYKHRNHQQTIERLKLIDLPVAKDRIMILMLEQGRYQEIVANYNQDTDYSEDRLLVFAKAHYLLQQYIKAEKILSDLRLKQKDELLTRKKIETVELLVKTKTALNKLVDAGIIYQAFLKNNEGTSYVSFQNALTQLGKANFDAAIDEIDALAKSDPDNIQIAQVLALAQFGKKNYQAVINELEPFRSRRNEQSLILLANAYNEIGRPQDTIELFRGVQPGNAAKITLSRAHLIKRDNKKALSVLKPVSIEEGNHAFNFKLAQLWFDLDQFETVITNFSEDTSQPAEIKYLVTNSYLRLKRVSEARQFAKNEPSIDLSLELQGYLEVASGNLNTAISIYKELVMNKPNKRSYFLLASSYLENKNYSDSLQTIQAGAELSGDNLALLILANKMLLEVKDSETYQWLDSIQESHRDYKLSQLMLANYEIAQNQNDRVIHRLTPLMKDGDNQVYYLMAKAKQVSDPKESLRLLEQSLDADFSLKVASLLHRFYVKTKDADNLGRIANLIEQYGGINVKTANLLARGYLVLGQYDKARELTKTLITQGYGNTGKELSGDILAHQGEYIEAADTYKQLLASSSSESLLVKYFTVKVKVDNKKMKDVLSEAEEKLARNPEMHALRNFVGIKYINNDNKAAIRHLQFLADKFPDDIVLLNNLAWANLDVNPVVALKYSQRAYRAYSNNDDIVDTYVRALVKNNQAETARQILEARLKDNPENQNLQNLMQSLN